MFFKLKDLPSGKIYPSVANTDLGLANNLALKSALAEHLAIILWYNSVWSSVSGMGIPQSGDRTTVYSF